MSLIPLERLVAHVRELAINLELRLIEDPRVKPDEAFAYVCRGIIVVAPIQDETMYAIALHEMGHCMSPFHSIGHIMDLSEIPGFKMIEEQAAWKWARRQALDWSPTMQVAEEYSLNDYAQKLKRYELKHQRAHTWADEIFKAGHNNEPTLQTIDNLLSLIDFLERDK